MLGHESRKLHMTATDDASQAFSHADGTALTFPQARDDLLSALSVELGGLSSVAETMERVGKLVGTSLNVQHCIFAEFVNEDERSMVTYGWHAPNARPLFGIYPMRDFLSNEQRIWINAGTLSIIADTQRIARVGADQGETVDTHSFIIVPQVRDDHWQFMLCVIDAGEREWQDEEIALTREVAERVWMRLEHAHVEEALRQSEQRIQSLFESIDEAYALYELLYDTDGRTIDARVIEANPAYSTLLERQDPVGKTLSMLSPSYSQSWIDLLAAVVRNGTPRRFEQYNQWLDRWFDVYVAPAPANGAKRVFLVFNDITEQRRMIEAIRESESRYRSLFDSIDQGFCTIEVIFDEDDRAIDYRFVEINPAFARNTGLHDAIDGRARELIPALEEEWYEIYGEVAKTRQPIRFEAEAAALGRWYNLYAYPIGNPEDNRVAVLFEDITSRRNAEAALRSSEERVRAIVEEATDYAIFTIDPTGLIEDWFPGAEAVFGWTADEAVGMPFAQTFTPEDRAAGVPDEELQRAHRDGWAPDIRWHRHKSGSRVFIEGAVRARLDLDGGFLGALKIGRDATEDRLAEQRRTEHEQRVRRALRQEISQAAAELRALSHRLLLVQEEERRFLARELHDEIGQSLTGLALTLSTAGQQDERIVEAQRIVAELTEQVRHLSMDLRPAALDAYGLIPALRSLLERYEKQTTIKVDLRAEGAERRFSPLVESTAYRIVQEALTNVARHSDTTDAIVQLIGDEQVLMVSIRDQGRGFDSQVTQEGSGLTSMRERAELLGGMLDIDTAPGAGVRITAELPLHDSLPAPSSESGAPENAP
jgi:PAS domain S-box-containing protein